MPDVALTEQGTGAQEKTVGLVARPALADRVAFSLCDKGALPGLDPARSELGQGHDIDPDQLASRQAF